MLLCKRSIHCDKQCMLRLLKFQTERTLAWQRGAPLRQLLKCDETPLATSRLQRLTLSAT